MIDDLKETKILWSKASFPEMVMVYLSNAEPHSSLDADSARAWKFGKEVLIERCKELMTADSVQS